MKVKVEIEITPLARIYPRFLKRSYNKIYSSQIYLTGKYIQNSVALATFIRFKTGQTHDDESLLA